MWLMIYFFMCNDEERKRTGGFEYDDLGDIRTMRYLSQA